MNGDDVLIGGLACPWNTLSKPISDKETGATFCERIAPYAFEKALLPGHEVILKHNHTPLRHLAARSAGTLRVWQSDSGLHFLADLQGNAYGGIWLDIELRKIRGASVAMLGIVYDNPSGYIRTVQSAGLEEISFVDNPAYPTRLTFDAAPQQSLRDLARDVARGDYEGDNSMAHLRRALELEQRLDEWESTALYRSSRAKLAY